MQRSPRSLAVSRSLALGLGLVVTPFLGSCMGANDGDAAGTSGAGGEIPTFTVDPSWPLEMPNKWIMGAVTAVFVDAQDHIWVTHITETLTPEETSAVQDPPLGDCFVPAPGWIEFNPRVRRVRRRRPLPLRGPGRGRNPR